MKTITASIVMIQKILWKGLCKGFGTETWQSIWRDFQVISVGKSQLDKILEKVPPTAKMTPTSRAKTETITGKDEANIIIIAFSK